MTENWIYTNEQTVLQLGDNDISVTIPYTQLRDYAQMAMKGEPIKLPAGAYTATGWTKVNGDPNRATMRLSRNRLGFVRKPTEVKLVRSNNIEWKLRKNNL